MAGKPVKDRKLLVRSVLSRVVVGNCGRWVRPSPSGELSEDALGRLSVYFLYMLMQLAIGLITGAMAVGLVYGMKKFGDLMRFRQDGHTWKESFKSEIKRWQEGVSLLLFILFLLMVVIGIGADIILG